MNTINKTSRTSIIGVTFGSAVGMDRVGIVMRCSGR